MSASEDSLALELTDLGKRFGHHWVLSHVSLQVRWGESIALFGRNGSGKSTLLKIVATLLPPTTGSVMILGKDPDGQKREIRGQIRLLSHEKQLYSALTIREIMRLAAGIRGIPRDKVDGKIEELLDKFQIKRFGDRRVSQLSEGMKKRVVLARILLGSSDPDLILLDEPHPTLDTEGRMILDGLIQDWRKEGKTVILASHDHDIALSHVDRLIVLDDGKVTYDGLPKKI